MWYGENTNPQAFGILIVIQSIVSIGCKESYGAVKTLTIGFGVL